MVVYMVQWNGPPRCGCLRRSLCSLLIHPLNNRFTSFRSGGPRNHVVKDVGISRWTQRGRTTPCTPARPP